MSIPTNTKKYLEHKRKKRGLLNFLYSNFFKDYKLVDEKDKSTLKIISKF